MISVLLLIGLVAWIIKDHRAVMKELVRMREQGKAAENHSQTAIIR